MVNMGYHGNISYLFRCLIYLGCKSRKRIATQAGFIKLFLPLRLVYHLAGHAAINNQVLTVNEIVLRAT